MSHKCSTGSKINSIHPIIKKTIFVIVGQHTYICVPLFVVWYIPMYVVYSHVCGCGWYIYTCVWYIRVWVGVVYLHVYLGGCGIFIHMCGWVWYIHICTWMCVVYSHMCRCVCVVWSHACEHRCACARTEDGGGYPVSCSIHLYLRSVSLGVSLSLLPPVLMS